MLPLLKKAKLALSKTYFIDEFLDNSLIIAFTSDEPIFGIVIIEEDTPDTLLFSPAVNAPDPFSVADVTLKLIHVAKTELAEPFLVTDDGEIIWGQDAYELHFENNLGSDDKINLAKLESPSKLVN